MQGSPCPFGKLVRKVVEARPRNITTYTRRAEELLAIYGRVIDEAIERAQIH